MKSRPTSVYVIASGDYVKIGYSVNPQTRLKGISSGMPEKPYLAGSRSFSDLATARYVEQALHWRFRANRTHGEWFRVAAQEACSALRGARARPNTPLEASKAIAAIFDAQYATPSLLD